MRSRAGMLVSAIVVLLLAGWGAGEVSSSFLQAGDLDVVRDLAARRTPVLIVSASVLSIAGSVVVVFPLTVVCCALLYRGGRRAAAVFLALSVGGAGLIFTVEKLIVGRPRPPVAHVVAASHSSFPSGHATLSTAFYVALVMVFLAAAPRRVVAATAAATAGLLITSIALSRVYLGVHYPSDVAGGVLLGATWTLLVAYSLRHGVRRRSAPGAARDRSELRTASALAEERAADDALTGMLNRGAVLDQAAAPGRLRPELRPPSWS